jgi:DNA-binding protein YbaB
VDRPNWSALEETLDGLQKTIDNMDSIHKRMLQVTGSGWSDDRMIRATVGPRGQLTELEIDPRVYRNPNSKALAAAIMAAIRTAVTDAAAKSCEIMDENLPGDLRMGTIAGMDMAKLVGTHDADLLEGTGE